MSHQDNSVFVDASGRRGRVMRWAAIGVGAGCVGFLTVVVAGFFGSGPTGRPLPWVDQERPAPALIGADPSPTAEDDESASPRPRPSASRTTTAPSPSASTVKDRTTAPAQQPTATSGVDAGAGDAPADMPGRGRGATKRPK